MAVRVKGFCPRRDSTLASVSGVHWPGTKLGAVGVGACVFTGSRVGLALGVGDVVLGVGSEVVEEADDDVGVVFGIGSDVVEEADDEEGVVDEV